MDVYDIFRKLSVGATFKNNPLDYLQLRKEQNGDSKEDTAAALDFFGDGRQEQREEEEEEEGDKLHESWSGVGSVTSILKGRKRKKDIVKTSLDFETAASESETDTPPSEVPQSIQVFSSKQSEIEQTKKSKHKKRKTDDSIKVEEVNAFLNAHHINVSGHDVPDPIRSFTDLKEHYNHVPLYLQRNINSLKYHTPTPIQMQAIPLLLQGREILACAPTGSGKTAAFIIPILTQLKRPKKAGFRAVIVSPTRELAQQIYREAVRLSDGSGYRIHVLTKATASVNSFGPESSRRFDILVTTPNRLVHLLSQEPPGISLNSVEWLILDECDKLFEDGETGFKDQVAQIYSACDNPGVRRGLFSATLASNVEEFCRAHLDNYVRITIGQHNAATDTIQQQLLFVGQESGKLLAMRELIQKGFTPPVLVFVQSIERAKELFHELIYDGMNVDVIHSERTQAQRDNVVKCFRSGQIWILICTDLMGRGVDFKGVNMVINYDFPPTAVSYIHRIGRTGRAGMCGKAITFFTEDDADNLKSIVNVMRSSGCEVPDWMLKLKKPSKDKLRKLSKNPLKRPSIKTASKYDLTRSKRKKEMIAASKRRKKSDTKSWINNINFI